MAHSSGLSLMATEDHGMAPRQDNPVRLIPALAAVLLLSIASSGQVQSCVVVPQNVAVGEQASGSIVLNPKDWQNLPGVRVIPFQLPGAGAGNAASILNNYVAETNPGQSFPANHAFPFKVVEHLALHLK